MLQQDSLDLFTEEDKKFMKGRHLVTIFHNEQNLYSVVRIRLDSTNLNYDEKEAVVTGYFPRIHEHESYIFFGQMKDHPKFGVQFHVEHFRKDIPHTRDGVINYLSSELFKGIGKKTAESIVDTLGENAISLILEKPSLLDTIPRLNPEKAKDLYDNLMEHQGLEKVMITLNQFGFGPQLSMRIYQVYKQETLTVIQKNPYQLVEDIEGIGFGRADELGFQVGIAGNHEDRIKAACLYTLEQDCLQEGHVFLETEQLLKSVKTLLEENKRDVIDYSNISNEVIKLGEEGKIIIEDNRVYTPSLFFSEKGLAAKIEKILLQREYEDQFPESEFLLALGSLEERLGVEYAPAQKEAIQTALLSPMLILTGGPGTGKTTVIKGIVELFSELHGVSLDPKDYKKDDPFPFVLAAPTGRAAKRMTESTGLPAVTIHRLLGWNGSGEFSHNEDHPIAGKILIVDEMSMVDTWLANQLFKALPENFQVILVGDEDQLPSVGPGQVLKDLLRSKRIPTVQLQHIYRQEDGSSIIGLAHEIKQGKVPVDIRKQQPDRSFFPCSTTQIAEVVKKVVENAKKKGYSAKDIQVLAPMYRGPAGIDKLNVLIQEIFNPNSDGKKRELSFGDVTYRVGDKVLQLVNQPESSVYNGDIGQVVSIIYAKENTEKQDMLIVSFDGLEITYTKTDLSQITLAYCCSIHKSQGSEFPIVIMPVVKSYYRMLRRNLIYTGITRSKKFLILCGEEEALRLGVERNNELERKTTLYEKIQTALSGDHGKADSLPLGEDEKGLIAKLMNSNPMIGMENVSPYDFMTEE
ncbi:exodeoxyribonuclease V alpha subunit [Peribacillus deserti]|uniref:ATP-dependent RecD2 DNA helicase n=1 Tax=Peribacillus deserti TaxID=673318 RepID=A0ABS2QFK1_9BACI|nr:ATP-dependent RecD-like DNA helicase [Peribacillus deserti]MBM7691872.1 exodeoxyribonuclease V alpha subunit [Peribacillus deserti]